MHKSDTFSEAKILNLHLVDWLQAYQIKAIFKGQFCDPTNLGPILVNFSIFRDRTMVIKLGK